ncbi:MAG: sulfite reductase subunit A [Gemmatimonadales bacterium]|nr:sulfite reductase subunit A [Gemmatimonadales bacterium]NIN50978.1 sulfite reductase subunit A [Gemmatimonadales bacterium]NIP08442.1 sulfite reductase subunit A [Gemmatimonadales bacterium]
MSGLNVALTREPKQVLNLANLEELLSVLGAHGYQLTGPTVREGAIVYDRLESVQDLPIGWSDEQDGGTYRLKRRDDDAHFGFAVGPHSWKKFLLPPVTTLWRAERSDDGFKVINEREESPRYAFIGVRSCELHAIGIQDRVFLKGPYTDTVYLAHRERVFTVAVNCGRAGGTCFCVSMGTGPRATFGFDLALTEVLSGERHYFLLEVGTERGAEVLAAVEHREATAEEEREADSVLARTATQMGRTMETADIKNLLYRNREHPRWDDVAGRCLTCGNCTMVCPTCFCTTVEDMTDLRGEEGQRVRKWDSCFTMDFSYIHGGSIRASPKSRYRQWMSHKLASWIDQYGTSGCVGCGRCITWCPTAIDITEEVRAMRASEATLTATPGRANERGEEI